MSQSNTPPKRGWSLSVSSLLKSAQASQKAEKPTEKPNQGRVSNHFSAATLYQKISVPKPTPVYTPPPPPPPQKKVEAPVVVPEKKPVDVIHVHPLHLNPNCSRVVVEGDFDCGLQIQSILTASDNEYITEKRCEEQEYENAASSAMYHANLHEKPKQTKKRSADVEKDAYMCDLRKLSQLCKQAARLEDLHLASEIEVWKKSTKPFADRVVEIEEMKKSTISNPPISISIGVPRRKKEGILAKAVQRAREGYERRKQELIHKLQQKSNMSLYQSEFVNDKTEDWEQDVLEEEKEKNANPPPCSPTANQDSNPLASSSSSSGILTISPSLLQTTVQTLLNASTDKERFGNAMGDMYEISWHLNGTLNKMVGGESACDDAKSIHEFVESLKNEQLAAILRAKVVDMIVHKMEKTSKKEDANNFGAVLVELAILDRRYVQMIFGSLYLRCPLLIPEMPSQEDISPKEFEKRINQCNMFITLYCALVNTVPRQGKNPFTIHYILAWIDKVNELAKSTPFLEYAGIVEPFLSATGEKLKTDCPKSYQRVIDAIVEVLPTLELVNGKTVGTILRLRNTVNTLLNAVPDC